MSILDIASQMQADLDAQKTTIQEKEREVEAYKSELNALKKELEAKRKDLAKQEKEINAVKRDVELKLENIRRNDEITKSLLEIENGKDFAKKLVKEANEKNNDANQKLAEVAKRELALTKREAEYKDSIKKEIVEGFLKGIKL